MDLNVVKEKAKTVAQMSENTEIKALSQVIIKLVEELENKEKEMGFKSK